MKFIRLMSLVFLVFVSCGKGPSSNNMEDGDSSLPMLSLNDGDAALSNYLESRINITGRALNAKEGAVIYGQSGMVIIEGLEEWDSSTYDQIISVEGRLLQKTWQHREPTAPEVAAPQGTFYYLVEHNLNPRAKPNAPDIK